MPSSKRGLKVRTGPRGGRYVMRKGGRKEYLPKSSKKTSTRKRVSTKRVSTKRVSTKRVSEPEIPAFVSHRGKGKNSFKVLDQESGERRTKHTASPDIHAKDVPAHMRAYPMLGVDGKIWVVAKRRNGALYWARV